MSSIILLLAVVLMLIALLVYEKIKTRKTLKRLNIMLEKGVSNSLIEEIFDETIMSAIEVKFYQFLRSSYNSEELILKDKENISMLVSDISHQTKTPLSNIILYTQLLLETDVSTNNKELLAALSSQSDKLRFLIESLIKASRLEANIIKIAAKNDSIQKLTTLAVTGIKMQAKQKNITIINNANDEHANFDIKWTAEALFNILENAVKYSKAGSKIMICTKSYEFFCCTEIADEGMGISAEDENKIFTRFYRAASVSDIEGVGIGLYLSRAIVTAQDGYIRVVSNTNKGSVFKIYLPK